MILHGITIVTSSFLRYLVQSIVAKQFLPRFGGPAAARPVSVIPSVPMWTDRLDRLFKILKQRFARIPFA